MSLVRNRIVVLLLIFGMTVTGGVVGANLQIGRKVDLPGRVYPLPHHIPKYADGATLRFAMVHDVIHERYPVHGKTYYEERNRRVREALPDPATADAKDWPLVDDLAVGLDRLGQHAEAVALMRAKLQRQLDQGMMGRDLYPSYANLGTFLILWQLDEGFAEVKTAKERVRESIDWVQRSIAVKPDAHFGREVWQAVLEEWLLAFLDDPTLLPQYDMVGNGLKVPVDPQRGRAYLNTLSIRTARGYVAHSDRHEEFKRVRSSIAVVGAENGWTALVKTSHRQRVEFDEPTLGIIGMWRYGGGANPHFSLALAETMLRVGQRYIAWCAYERTVQLAAAIPEAVRADFVTNCRRRQNLIENQLSSGEAAKLRPRFEAELKFGKAYQATYQEYEAAQIAAGASVDDPHFYDAFDARHGPIASPVGMEEQFVLDYSPPWAFVLLGAGVFAFLTAALLQVLRLQCGPVPG